MDNSLQGVLARIPGLAGYLGAQQNDQRMQMGQLQQIGALEGILARRQAAQQEQELTGMLAGAGSADEAIKRLLASGKPQAIAVAAKLKSLQPEPAKPIPIGAGGLLNPDGTIVAPASRPATVEPTKLERLIELRDRYPEGSPNRTILDNAIRKESETAKQITPTVVNNQPAPITAVTIADPNDPNKTVIVDGRTGRTIGAGPKLTATGERESKREFNMTGIGSIIKEADDLLRGTSGKDLPTGSTLGNVADIVSGVVGYSPPGAREAETLKAIGGALVSKMPRMEGPQSDRDVLLYKEMAARVGDPTVPRDRRLAALEKVKELWAKYEKPATTTPAAVPTATGPNGEKIEFRDGQWRPAK